MSTEPSSSRDLPGTIIAAAFILLGAVFWWDTTDMSDPDSYVFPRSIIVLMIAFSLLLILRNLAFGGGPAAWRRRGPVAARDRPGGGAAAGRLGVAVVGLGSDRPPSEHQSLLPN